MKKTFLINAFFFALSTVSCNKENTDQVTLVASTTQATVGQTVSVTLVSSTNVSNWTVTPSASATKLYTLTTQKVNTFSFAQPGQYLVGVRTRNVVYDSSRHQSLDSCWRNGGGNNGGCKRGVDSASVSITVK